MTHLPRTATSSPVLPRRRRAVALLATAVRFVAGLALGTVSALLNLGYVVAACVAIFAVPPWPHSRQAALARAAAGARRVAAIERWRVTTCLGADIPPNGGSTRDDRRALAYLAVRWLVGILGGLVLLLLVYGAGAGVALLWGWLVTGDYVDNIRPTPALVAYVVVFGLVLLFLDVAGIIAVAALDRQVARHFLGPHPEEAMRRRITELTASRAEVVAAVDDERRRIERDLHDGVQQRLVALGMLIGRARRAGNPEAAEELLRQAHEQAQQALDDLRDVSWRVYPAALHAGGLQPAVETVAERCPVPVNVRYDLPHRLARPVETVAYFMVCEAVTNAAKHTTASAIDVHIGLGAGTVVVRVHDDGAGGADPTGTGLTGLAQRVAALDGTFHVASPPGGPTTITAELPCASS